MPSSAREAAKVSDPDFRRGAAIAAVVRVVVRVIAANVGVAHYRNVVVEVSDDMAPYYRVENYGPLLTESVHFARLRCHSTDELIDIACDVGSGACYSAQRILVDERSVSISGSQQAKLAAAVRVQIDPNVRIGLPPKHRSRVDRLLRNVGRALETDTARQLSVRELDSPWKIRRDGAIQVLRRVGIDDVSGAAVRDFAASTGSVDALVLATQQPGVFAGMSCCEVLNWQRPQPDNYVGALVLARMLVEGLAEHEHCAAAHLAEWVRALGRLGAAGVELEPGLADLLGRAVWLIGDGRLLSLVLSVAGRLGWSSVIDLVERRVSRPAAV
jgi:hypothetical protein